MPTPVAPTRRRTGFTLTEVLVSLFVMALGLISLLTLFPLGAIQIGLALRDDRCKQTAIQADAFMRAYWQANVAEKITAGNPDDFVRAFDDPNLLSQAAGSPSPKRLNTYLDSGSRLPTGVGSTLSTTMVGSVVSPTAAAPGDTYESGNDPSVTVTEQVPSGQPSYPVYLDPIGFLTKSGARGQYWVARDDTSQDAVLRLPRRTLAPWASNVKDVLQGCCLLDDLTFDRNGVPENVGGVITRQGRYNWAAVLQRRNNNVRAEAKVTLLCFDGRPPLANLPDMEKLVDGPKLDDGMTSIPLDNPPTPSDPTSPPLLRKGGWVMDGTWDGAAKTMRADFYRVVSISEPSATGTVTIDIDPPIPTGTPGRSHLYFFSGLTEVFARPKLEAN